MNKIQKTIEDAVLSIAFTVCDYYGITFDDMQKKTRKVEIRTPRQMAHKICKEILGVRAPYRIISDKIGGKDHATALHSCNVMQNYIDTDKDFAEKYNEIKGICEMNLKSHPIMTGKKIKQNYEAILIDLLNDNLEGKINQGRHKMNIINAINIICE